MVKSCGMPSFLAGLASESVTLASSDTSPYDPPHRKSQEKTSSRSQSSGVLMNGYAADGAVGNKRIIDGVFLSDANGLNPSLQSLPNGRSSESTDSKERSRSRNDSNFSITNGIGNHGETERQTPGSTVGMIKPDAVLEWQPPVSGNGDVAQLAGPKRSESGQSVSISHHPGPKRAHSSSAPQDHSIHNTSWGQADVQSKSLDASLTGSPINRFSSPPILPASTTPLASSASTVHPGSVRLQHRHTLQVPRVSTNSVTRDFSLPTTSISSDLITDGDRSPATFGIGRVSTSLGRRPTRSIHSDQYGDEIAPDDDMARWTETIRHKRASRRQKKEEEEDDDRVVVGTKVDMNHVNWVTAYNMLTGIRFTVSRTNAKIDRDLTDADFDAQHKFSFDM